MESVRIVGVSVLSGVEFKENVWTFSQGQNKTVRNNETSVLSGCP